jgi:hypothetical protein
MTMDPWGLAMVSVSATHEYNAYQPLLLDGLAGVWIHSHRIPFPRPNATADYKPNQAIPIDQRLKAFLLVSQFDRQRSHGMLAIIP